MERIFSDLNEPFWRSAKAIELGPIEPAAFAPFLVDRFDASGKAIAPETVADLLELDWVGVSMGGLIGMALAGQPGLPLPVPMRRLVLNDVGPSITWGSVQRMQQYVGRYGRFANLADAAAELRQLSQGFGPVPDDLWLELCSHMVRQLPDGGLTLHYDPAIGEPIRALTAEAAQAAEAMVWSLYEQISAKVLLVRGLESDLLTEATAQAMTERGPKAQLVQWAGYGHAPTLTDPTHIQTLADFLLGS